MTTLNYVSLLIESQDAAQDATGGPVVVTPSAQVTAAGVTEVTPVPIVRQFSGGQVTVRLVANDNSGTSPAPGTWFYGIQLPGWPAALQYAVNFAGGSSQRLDDLTPLTPPVVPSYPAYLLQPSGTATAGYVPIATGSGEASQWGPLEAGDSGYPSSPVVSGTPSAGQVLTATSPTAATWQAPSGGGSGTVTAVSVASANGFAGTVANPATTPAVTVSTSVTGLLKGNGTAVSAAAAGTDYVAPTGSGAALTGITAAQVGADASGAASTVQAASLQKSANLSDLASVSTARTNLGLGTAATQNTGAFDAAGAAAAVASSVAAEIGASNGIASLDSGGHVPSSQITPANVPTLNQSTTGNAATATNLAGAATFPAEVTPKVVTLTQSSGSVAVNGALGNVFRLVLTASGWTLANPTGMTDGQPVRVRLIQDGTGSRTLSYGSAWDFGAAGAPTLSTGAGKVDYIVGEWSADANGAAGAVAVSAAPGF